MVPEPFDRLRNHLSKGSMSATLITFGTAPDKSETIKKTRYIIPYENEGFPDAYVRGAFIPLQ